MEILTCVAGHDLKDGDSIIIDYPNYGRFKKLLVWLRILKPKLPTAYKIDSVSKEEFTYKVI